MINWKLFGILWGGCVFGSIAILPFLVLVQGSLLRSLSIPLSTVLLVQVTQSAIFFALVTFFGLLLAKKVGFKTPLLSNLVQKKSIKGVIASVLLIAVPLGLLAGFFILVLDATLPLLAKNAVQVSTGPVSLSSDLLKLPEATGIRSTTPSVWQGFLASFYGGINEEVLMRLFAMSFFVWIFSLVSQQGRTVRSSWVVWVAIIASAVLFGLGHLPLVVTLTALTPYIALRALLLNGLAGIIFGWLFWKKGLEAAIVAHFTADVFVFVILPLTN